VNLSMFLDPSGSSTTVPPSDVTFVFKNELQEVTDEIKAHKVILGFASDVFNAEFFGNFKSEDIVTVKDCSREVFELFIAFIYDKELCWDDYGFEIICSLYYLSDKYNVECLKNDLIFSIHERDTSKEGVLDVGMLAEEYVIFPELSNALYSCAAACLKKEFGRDIMKVYEFYTNHPGLSEAHALIIFKMMSMINKINVCLNCKMKGLRCYHGHSIASTDVVLGAKVFRGGSSGFLFLSHVGPEYLVGRKADGTLVSEEKSEAVYRYKYHCNN